MVKFIDIIRPLLLLIAVTITLFAFKNRLLDNEEIIPCEEINLKLAPFPDYVFSSAYQLPTISELGDYIKKNNRLPNMPTAIEVEKNGIGVGELQIKLVEKIEELTLYIIDLEKRLKKLEH